MLPGSLIQTKARLSLKNKAFIKENIRNKAVDSYSGDPLIFTPDSPAADSPAADSPAADSPTADFIAPASAVDSNASASAADSNASASVAAQVPQE